jgi:hypothetical protein
MGLRKGVEYLHTLQLQVLTGPCPKYTETIYMRRLYYRRVVKTEFCHHFVKEILVVSVFHIRAERQRHHSITAGG